MRSNLIQYELTGDDGNGQYKFKFINEGFDDIELSVYGIEFIENDDNANMKFNYDIHEGTVPTEELEKFEHLVGDFLIQVIEEGIKKHEITYTGGVDENRTDDPEQLGV